CAAAERLPVDPLDHRLAGDVLERLTRQARRAVTSRDHGDEPRRAHVPRPSTSRKTRRISRAVLSPSKARPTTTHQTFAWAIDSHFRASFSVTRAAPGSSNAS